MVASKQGKQRSRFFLPSVIPKFRVFSMLMFFSIGFAMGAFAFWNPFDIEIPPSGSGKRAEEAAVPAETEKKADLWTSPMHPEVVEKESGNSPICGVKLVALAAQEDTKKKGAKKERKILYWRAPMDPTYISDRPGKSPMGMDLVPVYAPEEGAQSEEGVVKINPAITQQIGVRTESVRIGVLQPVIRTVGILDYNEKNIYLVNTKFDGWIEKVYVNYVGEKVRKGQKLFEIYSPELVSTQEEYLTALGYLEKIAKGGCKEAIQQSEALWEATRKRLAYWDITEKQVRRLEETGELMKTLAVVSSVDGVVVEKMSAALEGMYVKAGMNLYQIADLSTVWVHADIYESELSWIQPGLEAVVMLPYFPGETFKGHVLYLQPFVTEKTRSVKACIELKNRDDKLQPNMYAEVKIKPVISQHAVLVPEDAVIRTGERNVVFIDLGDGRFLPKEVVLGVKAEGVYEVKSGLQGNEQVVVSAQFLLDSESRLQEFIRKLKPASQGKQP